MTKKNGKAKKSLPDIHDIQHLLVRIRELHALVQYEEEPPQYAYDELDKLRNLVVRAVGPFIEDLVKAGLFRLGVGTEQSEYEQLVDLKANFGGFILRPSQGDIVRQYAAAKGLPLAELPAAPPPSPGDLGEKHE